MPGVDFDDDGRQRRKAPGFVAPPETTPGPNEYAQQDDGVTRPPPLMPNSPLPPNVNIGNTGHSTPSSYSSSDVAARLRAAGVSEHVANDEASYLAMRANEGRNLDDIIKSALPSYMQRSGAPAQSGGGSSRPPSAFSDALGGPVNDYANERFQRLTSPPPDSGQAMLEAALKKIAAQFEQGGYTPGEMEQFQTQAIDPMERLRTARKQQTMQQLASRGIDPNSGVARSMLSDVDRQFDAVRSQQQTQIGTQAANERSSRMLQSLEMLSGLASTEEGRLDKAFDYRKVPLMLGDRAFNQSMQLFGQTNPMNLFNPAMQLANMGQNQQFNQGNILAQLAAMLLNGGG